MKKKDARYKIKIRKKEDKKKKRERNQPLIEKKNEQTETPRFNPHSTYLVARPVSLSYFGLKAVMEGTVSLSGA